MEALTVTIRLSYDSPISASQLTELQDKFYNLLDAEINDGELSIEAECTDFEVEIERDDR